MKVLHVFDHSLPLHSGYAFRSASILHALQKTDIETVHVTGPKHAQDSSAVEEVEGLQFHRCLPPIPGGSPADQLRCVGRLRGVLKDLIARFEPDILHCHSPCLNGLAGLGLGVPLVYEVRACWEDAAVSSGTTIEGSVRYRASRMLETLVSRRASALIVICDGLREEFLSRGLAESHVHVVGNAIDPASMPPADPRGADELRTAWGLQGRPVIGFFGSFYHYEGLELLVNALPMVVSRIPDATLVLAGGGESEPAIRDAVRRKGLESNVRLLGRVPHERIGACYTMADVMVFPRLRDRLTDMVTPLKPLEAMYLGTPVVASDVGGHRELIRPDETGLLFEAGDGASLARQIVRVLADDRLAGRMVQSGREYVNNERLWHQMAQRYRSIYKSVSPVHPGEGPRTCL